MPLVYIDGLEDNSAVVAVTGTGQTYGVAARTAKGIQITGSSSSVQIRFPTPYSDTVTVGFAMRPSTVSGTNVSPAAVALLSDLGTVVHVAMLVVNGNLQIVRGDSTTPVLASSTFAPFPAANRWYYVEMQARLHDSLGTVKVNVDGVEVINATALDTKNLGVNTTFDTVRFGMGVGGTTIFDDLYMMAGAGDAFQGDCTVATLLPTGNGFVNQFLGSDGNSVDNYLLVDEQPPSSTDYVGSATIGQQDLYTLADLTGSGTVLAVAPTIYAAKDEVGSRTLKPLVRGATTNAGAALPLDFAYATRQSVFLVNPETGLAWTAAEVNALQAGVEVA